MALLFADSFPYSTSDLVNYHSRYQEISQWNPQDLMTVGSTSGRFGGRYLRIISSGGRYGRLRHINSATATTIMLQFGLRITSWGDLSYLWVAHVNDGIYSQVSFLFTASAIHMYRGCYTYTQGTLIDSANYGLSTNVWHQCEIKVLVNGSTGTILLKIDGDTVCDWTNKNTQYTAHNYADSIQFGPYGDAQAYGSGSEIHISDVICMDTTQVSGQNYCNDLLGNKMVKQCLPTANGNYAQWTPSAGSNWQNVDDDPASGPNGDTDYNKTAGVGNIDTFVVPDVNAGATINAVACSMSAKLEEPGTAKLKGLMRTGSTNGEGTEVTVPSSYSYLQSFIYVDPVSGVPMTAAEFNAAEFGYKRSA